MKKYGLALTTVSVLACLNLSACTFDRLRPPAPVAKPGVKVSPSGYVFVQPGDTLDAIADRYGLKAGDIATVNGIQPPYDIASRQRLMLPYPVQYTVKGQDTLSNVARMFGLDIRDLAEFNGISPSTQLRAGQILKIPGGNPGGAAADTSFKTFTIEDVEPLAPQKLPPVEIEELKSSSKASPKAEPVFAAKENAAKPVPVAAKAAKPPEILDVNENDPVAAVLTAMLQRQQAEAAGGVTASHENAAEVTAAAPAEKATEKAAAAAEKPVAENAAASPQKQPQKQTLAEAATQVKAEPVSFQTTIAPPSKQGFTWPVRGKVISSYGAKAGKMFNDGVNIAAPRGTPVRAASDGVVAYVGNDISSYGNIVLIRHNGGLMTAYAHMNTISVKKGSQIRRGQTLGTVGSTGKVANSQLHFEIRQGRKSLDPNKFLGGTS